MFFVVQLDSDVFKEKIVVPSIWLDKYNTLCLLPPVTHVTEVETLAKAQSTPKHGWQMHSVSFIQSFDSYSQAKESIKKSTPVTIELEEEEDEEHHRKEERRKRKRKLPPFLAQYSIETDDDEDGGSSTVQDDCSTESNARMPDPSIVKVEATEDATRSQNQRKARLDSTHNKSSTSFNSSFLLENNLQATGNSLSNIRLPDVKPVVTKCPCNSSCHGLILQSMAALQRQLETSNRMLYQVMDLVLAQGTRTINTLPGSPSGFPVTLPVRELSELHSLNLYLSDEQNFAEAIPYFTGLGGNNPRQVLKRIMEAFVSKELSVKLNWKGRGDKDPFNTYTKIHNLAYHIAKQNPKARYVTLAEVEGFIKDFLKMAPMRTVKGPKKSLNQDDKILRC